MQSGPGLELSTWRQLKTVWPRRMTSGVWVWYGVYYEKRVYCDSGGQTSLTHLHWIYLYSKYEFLLEQLKGNVNAVY